MTSTSIAVVCTDTACVVTTPWGAVRPSIVRDGPYADPTGAKRAYELCKALNRIYTLETPTCHD